MRRVVTSVVFCALLILFGGAFDVYAQTADELRARIEASNAQIDSIRAEIAELQKKLYTTAAEKATFQNAINGLNLSIQKIQKDISLTQAEINKKDLEIKDISGDIDSTASKIARSEEGVASALRELNVHDDRPVGFMLFAGGTLSSFFDETVALETLRTELSLQIEDLTNFKEDLAEDKSTAESKRNELAELSSRLGQERSGLGVARESQNKLLEDTKSKEATYQAQIAQKQAEQVAFERALFDLASQLQYIVDPASIPKAGKGVLRWPLSDIFITQQFGRTGDSGRLYASGTHDGIDMRASIGTPVKAAMSGIVFEINQGAAPFCQYGKWVLIKHPNGLATLYAHLSQISVKKGDTVTVGQGVGFAGNTGYSIGPHLHFTVYLADAISLKQYTCKSGAVVTVPIAPINAYLNPLSYLP